jgi:hypothetical protein
MAILRHWPSLAAARRAARLPQPEAWAKWTRARIIDALRDAESAGVRMSQRGIMDEGRPFGGFGLLAAAVRVFGSFAQARDAAGVSPPPRPRGPQLRWDPPLVLSEIRRRHREGEPLAMGKVRGSLVTTARRLFGTWQEAIEAAGFRYDQVRLAMRYSDADLIALLQQLAADHPTWNRAQLGKSRSGLTLAHRFGSLDKALEAAGIRDWPRADKRRVQTQEEVIKELQRRAATQRYLSKATLALEDSSLYTSILRRFDSLADALRAAGLPVKHARASWTAESVLNLLRARHAQGRSNIARDLKQEFGSSVAKAAHRLLGGLRSACQRAGVPYQDGRMLTKEARSKARARESTPERRP